MLGKEAAYWNSEPKGWCSYGPEGLGISEEQGCLPITEFSATVVVRGTDRRVLWDCMPCALRLATLTSSHLSSVTLTTLLKKGAVVLPLLLFFINTPNLASKSLRWCSSITSHGQRNTYEVFTDGTRLTSLLWQTFVRNVLCAQLTFAVTKTTLAEE